MSRWARRGGSVARHLAVWVTAVSGAGVSTSVVTVPVAVVMVGWQAESLGAQVRMRSAETRMLRDAANRESQGDFEGAERILLELLQESPGSSGALYALERVLRAQGQERELLPAVDRFLENDPGQSGVRYLKLRVLMEVDSLDALRREAEAWLAADPTSIVPYREVARVYERAFGASEALALLRRGRASSGAPDALALEIGDVLVELGEREAGVTEWANAVGDEGAQTVTVLRRLQSLPDDVEAAGRIVVGVLEAAEAPGRRRAATRVALDMRLEREAMRLARSVSADLSGRMRESFLSDVARRAREQELVDVAAWAYAELGDGASSSAERRQFDQRIIDVALATGDTTAALDAQRRVASSFPVGSIDRRRATAQVIRLEGTRAGPDRLRDLLADFREEYPNAPELDGLAATVASALHARGDAEGATAVLAGVEGPRSSLQMGYLLLAEGDLEGGRSALFRAVTGLPPVEATPVIQFTGLLERVSEEGGQALARAEVRAHRGEAREGARELAAAVPDLDPEDAPLLLAEAARIAERGGADRVAAEIRRTLVEGHPDAAEAAEASVALARFWARTPDGVPAAIRLLEELITVRPNAAIVPDARRELERLRARGQR